MDNCQDSTAIVLDQLANVIKSRKNADPEISYTAQLLNDGISEIARKVGEEAVECVVSSFSNKKKNLSMKALIYSITCWCCGRQMKFLRMKYGMRFLAEKVYRGSSRKRVA